MLIFYKGFHISQLSRGRYEVWVNFVQQHPVMLTSLDAARTYINVLLELYQLGDFVYKVR